MAARRIGVATTKTKNQNKMKKNIITILTVLALSTLAHARIGETVAQCDARYGELLKNGENGRHYNKSGFVVFVNIDKKGKCGKIHYFKKSDENISTLELKALMRANGTGWVERVGTERLKIWKNNSRVAYLLEGKTLYVYTLAYEAEEDAEAERKKVEELSSF